MPRRHFALLVAFTMAACGRGSVATATPDAAPAIDANNMPDAPFPATLAGQRSRLLRAYLAYLQANPTITQSNGLTGATLRSTCDLWARLDPAAREVYLTITARLWTSTLTADNSPALHHVTKLYRLVGGEGATPTNIGSCGGAEYNRMLMAMDPALHTAFIAAHDRGGNGLHDSLANTVWGPSSDLGGPHGPFTESAETDEGAPRGQAHYFRDVATRPATEPLGRLDLVELTDPFSLEMDLDYNCIHESNPLCSYTTYGAFCVPGPSRMGIELVASKYGMYESDWAPSCQ